MSRPAATGPAASSRRRTRLCRYAPILALLGWCCAVAPEYLLLERYFAASRLRDRTALARFATVVFEPHINGTVSTFEILAVTPERPSAISGMAGGGGGMAEAQRIAAMSLADPLHPADTTTANVALTLREVTVRAEVRSPDGITKTEQLVVVVQRARADGGEVRQGTWVVTGFR